MITYLLRRDRALVIGGLVAIVLLSWVYLLAGAGVTDLTGALAGGVPTWTPDYAAVVFVMWAVMMGAMMLPSAAPTILLYDTVARRSRAGAARVSGSTAMFGAGYLVVWIGFGGAATLLQYGLTEAAAMSAMMKAGNAALAGGLLVSAGVYQWTPLKQSCLRRCRSPLEFLSTYWRPGARGAFGMGVRHGAFCAGCCWMLMLLLFVGGIMNLAWITGIALFVMAEKLATGGPWISRIAGGALVIWGGTVLISA